MSTASLRSTNNGVVQLQITWVVLLSFSVFNLDFICRQISSLTNDDRIVDYFGIVREKTQRLIKLVLFQHRADDSTFRSQEETEEFNNTPKDTEGQATIENAPTLEQDIDTITSELAKIIKGLRLK